MTPGAVATVSNLVDATPQLAEDSHADGLRRPLALAEDPRTVEVHPRHVEVEVGAFQKPADDLGGYARELLEVPPDVLAVDLLIGRPHVLRHPGTDAPLRDLAPVIPRHGGERRLHEPMPECEERVRDDVPAVTLARRRIDGVLPAQCPCEGRALDGPSSLLASWRQRT